MRGDVGMPYTTTPRDSFVVRAVWFCVGVTVCVFLAGFALIAARQVAAFYGAAA